MAHLVRDDALQLLAIEDVEQAARDRDRRVSRTASRRKRVGIGVRHNIHGRPRQSGRDRHLVHDVVELPKLEPVAFVGRRCDLGDRRGAGRQQHGAISVEVSCERRRTADAQGQQRSDRHGAARLSDEEGVKAKAEHEQKRDEDNHDEPRLAAVGGLLLVQIHAARGMS